MNIYSQSKTEKFINNAKKIHGEKYSYEFAEYIHSDIKVTILCKLHGIFDQSPHNHLTGKGCVTCSYILRTKKQSATTELFIQRARVMHKEIYNYDLVEYKNGYTKVKISCKLHGIFEQRPKDHIKGQGCPKCTTNISKTSTTWLESLNIPDLIFEYKLSENTRKPVDGYSPSTNTVYQFHGDYWHGNPIRFNPLDINKRLKKTYGELYEKTIESDLWILSLGYNLVTMWESDLLL